MSERELIAIGEVTDIDSEGNGIVELMDLDISEDVIFELVNIGSQLDKDIPGTIDFLIDHYRNSKSG